MRLDGFAILKSVAGHAELFSNARDAVDKAALNILAAELKVKTFDLDRLKRTCTVLGTDTLALVLEHFPDTVPKALVGRIDPHHPNAATENAAWTRSHVVALATGAVKPEPKPQLTKTNAVSKAKKKPKPQDDVIAESFWATSVMAKRRRPPRATGKSK